MYKDGRGHGGRRQDKLAALFSCCVGVLCVKVYRFVFPWSAGATSLPLHSFCFVFTPSIPAFLLADTLLTWSSMLLEGNPKWSVSVGVRACVSARRDVQYKALSVFLTKPHCGWTALRKGYSDYYNSSSPCSPYNQNCVQYWFTTILPDDLLQVCSALSTTEPDHNCSTQTYYWVFLYCGEMVQQNEAAQLALCQEQ